MTRRKSETLRLLTDSERQALEQLSRSSREPDGQVAQAKGLLAVTAGKTYTEAAVAAGRKTGDTVARWVSEFNRQGLAALERRHGGGPALKYGPAERERILTEVRRQPTPEQDGTATWSLQLLCRTLRRAPDGLPLVSEDTIRTVLLAAGFTWQLGLAVWDPDEAGPYQTKPYPGASWQPSGPPSRQAHAYIRNGTAKMLTLFHPRSGAVRIQGVTRASNAVLQPWRKAQCTAILDTLPPPAAVHDLACRVATVAHAADLG